jgi:hypothetical protein
VLGHRREKLELPASALAVVRKADGVGEKVERRHDVREEGDGRPVRAAAERVDGG